MLKDFLIDLFNNPLKILEILDKAWKTFIEWVRNNLPFGNLIADILEVIGGTFKKLVINFLETIQAIKEKVTQIFQGIKDFITGVFTGDWALAWEGLKNIVFGVFGLIEEIIKGALNHIGILLEGLGDVLKIIIEPLLEIFKKLFSSLKEGFGLALEWIADKFKSIFEGVNSFVKNIINTIIDYINTMIQSIVGGINAIVNSANAVGSLVPGFSPLANVTAPQIPRLATGAVIPPNAEFAAILGDQRNGKNIEAPAAMFEEMLNRAVANAGSGEVTVTIPVTLDGEVIYKNQKKISTRHGRNLLNGS